MAKIQNERLSKIVADQLMNQIITREYVAGKRLPTEPEIMADFGVSRTVVREAAALLVSRGVVDVRPRRGMTVRKADGQGIAESLTAQLQMRRVSPSQLLQVRLVLETAIVRLAAVERTTQDLEKLAANLDRITVTGISIDETIRLDIEFHDLLAEATHNPFFSLIYRPIHELLGTFYRDKDTYIVLVNKTFGEHKAIFNTISQGLVEESETAMRNHLKSVERHVNAMIKDTSNI